MRTAVLSCQMWGALLVLVLIAATGCVSTRGGGAEGDSSAVLSAATRLHDEQISKLTFRVNQLKDDNTVLTRKSQVMSKQLAGLKAEVGRLTRENAALQAKINSESVARHSEMDALMKRVATQIAAAVNAAARASQRRPSPPVASGTSTASGEFFEYVVEPRATLSAIAKAYKVSIASIKRANNLKNDNIRIGQKLLIPKHK